MTIGWLFAKHNGIVWYFINAQRQDLNIRFVFDSILMASVLCPISEVNVRHNKATFTTLRMNGIPSEVNVCRCEMVVGKRDVCYVITVFPR